MDNSLIITILILLVLCLLFFFAAIYSRKNTFKRKNKILRNLQDLKVGAYSSNPSERITAIIKLDNLLSKALQYRMGNEKSCGENLKDAKKYFRKNDYENLWDVHKLRNRVVHDDMSIEENKMKNAYKVYNMSIIKILK